jgi:DNA recombination-dependent growth factor C
MHQTGINLDDRISFVLTDTLAIKRIKPLDILDEEKDKGQ